MNPRVSKNTAVKNAKPSNPDEKTCFRVLQVEVKRVGRSDDEDKKNRDRILELCTQIQELTNYVWMEWFAWHHANGSRDLIVKFQQEHIAYVKAMAEIDDDHAQIAAEEKRLGKRLTKKQRNALKTERANGIVAPRLDLRAVPKELANTIYHRVTSMWPDLNGKVVVQVLNKLTSLIGAKKAAKGSFSGWHAILMFREAIPSTTKPLPIPFTDGGNTPGNSNCKILLPESADDHHRMVLGLAREDVGKKAKPTVNFECTIWDKGRSMASRRITLSKIATGEYRMRGSNLVVKGKKIFAAIAYEIPMEKPTAMNGIAVVGPGRRKPLLIRVSGSNRNRYVMGDGRVIGETRRRLMLQRLGRKSAYRESYTSNSRGHGRDRGIAKVTKLSRRWRDFVVTYNRNLAVALVKECQAAGVGMIYLARPKKKSRFIGNVGNDSRFDQSSWDFYGLEKRISDVCAEAGIAVHVRPALPLRRLSSESKT